MLDPREETVFVPGKAEGLRMPLVTVFILIGFWPWFKNTGSSIELNIIHNPSLTGILDLTPLSSRISYTFPQ